MILFCIMCYPENKFFHLINRKYINDLTIILKVPGTLTVFSFECLCFILQPSID
jgi:hypothetical protein